MWVRESNSVESAVAKIQTSKDKQLWKDKVCPMLLLELKMIAESRVVKCGRKIASFAQLIFLKMRTNDEKVD